MEPAPAGVSRMQEQYGRSLQILGILVSLVLLIACANIANLMTAQAAARSRETALRVSLGAGGRRLVQLVLVESALVAFIASIAVTRSPQAPVYWDQVADHLRSLPGIERVSEAAWPLLSGTISNNFVSINGAPPSDVLAFFLQVSPGWLQTMKIPLTSGRDFRASDQHPGVAIVNRAFAKQFFAGKDPVGDSFETKDGKGVRVRFQIVGLAGDAYYRHLREPILPVAYVPFHSVDAQGAFKARGNGTFMACTSVSDPLALASTLRREVAKARPEFRVSNIRAQMEIDQAQTLRERLLAMLALFFAVIALLLAGVGLYGVLDYSVLQRRREIGIRMAVGARALDVASRVTVDVFSMVLIGASAGLALGISFARYIATLLYQVKATDIAVLTIPFLLVLAAALIAAAPAIIRAVRIDPVTMLRSE